MKPYQKLNPDQKQSELKKYRDLVLATIDYYLDHKLMYIKTPNVDSNPYLEDLKQQALAHFDKGRLSRLKQWFRDLTEMQVESRDLQFNVYLKEKTGYDVDIFEKWNLRVAQILEKGRITTDQQFYDIRMWVDRLSQKEPVDVPKIEKLNALLLNYERRQKR
ncbi:MAG: hypothetical protein AAF135_20570 [Bacteroidota bacterium]